MASSKVVALTKSDITTAAGSFQWTRQLPKWTVIVDGKQLPARPLVLEAAGVPPNDPTNSHQAVAILQDRGFDVYYRGKAIRPQETEPASGLDDLIQKIRGRYEGGHSLASDREREHRIEKDRKF